ncbi:GyrI-like domain-containing protein [Dysgonomonas sp. ZJ709]|uniref:AraC family transcriptional regulator n=1 Tax=Dysgonomonas sp. ZJ709 TaxID=2709797 RepID=UPI0013ED6EB3|nr:AraC family transcriptional regulator [Dysgonomonas sp. ZJ709]
MRERTINEYERAVNKVVDYINKHLYDSPDLKQLSEVANISEFHFHRIFKTIIGENIGEYVARLRLEDIAQRLRMSSDTLDKIALEKGYGTKNALSKAFKKHFGVSPSVYRILPQNNSFFFRDDERKEILLNPEVRIVDAKRIVYIRIIDWYGAPDSYAKAWKQLGQFAKENNLINAQTEYIGLSFDDPTITEPENCRFYACITVDKDIQPRGPFGVQTVDEGLYAVFTLRGSYSGLLDLYFNIYIKWLPISDYKLRKKSAFEKYLNSPDKVSEDELLTEIYVPVSKKKM